MASQAGLVRSMTARARSSWSACGLIVYLDGPVRAAEGLIQVKPGAERMRTAGDGLAWPADIGRVGGQPKPPKEEAWLINFDVIVVGGGPGRLCRRHPRGAAGHEGRGGRARAAGRHLPQLGLHPDQGAAAHLGNLSLYAARRRLRPEMRRTSASTSARSSSARARWPGSSTAASAPAEEEQGHRVRRLGQAERQGASSPSTSQRTARASPTSPPSTSSWRPARGRAPAGPGARRQADLDLQGSHGAGRPCRSRCWSSARAPSASSSPASTAPWAPR